MKKWILPVCLVLLVAIHTYVAQTALKKIPDSVLVSAATRLTPKTAFNADPPVAPFIREKSRVGVVEAIVTYTTPTYARLAAVSMKYGSFLGSGGDCAVISDMLAKDLFLTDNVLGFTVSIGDRSYVIGGVYWLDRSTMGKLAQSIYSEVFLPLGKYENQNAALSEFYIGLKDDSVSNALAKAEKVLDTPLDNAVVKNYHEDRALAAQSEKIIWLVLSVYLAAILGVKGVRRFGALIHKVRMEKKAYRTDIIKATVWAGVLCLSVLLIRLCSFDLVLPQSYLAFQGSLGEYIIHGAQTANAHADDSLYNYVYHIQMYLLAISAVILVGAPVVIHRIVCLLLHLPIRKNNQ